MESTPRRFEGQLALSRITALAQALNGMAPVGDFFQEMQLLSIFEIKKNV